MIFDASINTVSTGVAWIGSLCYTLQIYFDFSGYSDMAIGLGKMFGFDFMENFNFFQRMQCDSLLLSFE